MNICLSRNDNWTCGGIAQSGVYFSRVQKHENGSTSSSCSGYDTNVQDHLHRLADGGVFIDKRKVSDDALSQGTFSGPMLNELLPPNHVSRFMSPLEGVPYEPGQPLGGLDYVGLGVYSAIWREVGARIGVRVGDVMRWEDGTEEPIAPCTCWKGVCLGCQRFRHYVDRAPNTGWLTKAREPSGPDDHCPECKARLSAKADEEASP